jgi:hypothetical protein
MAEEPGKLSRISDDDENTDAVSTAAGATDTYSTGRLGDYPASDTETRELDANATDEETTEDTEQIRAQIEETRSQMSETIDAIQEKLSMSNIKEQVSDQINSAVDTAKDAVYDATIGKAGKFMQNVGRSLSDVTGSVGRGLSDSASECSRCNRAEELRRDCRRLRTAMIMTPEITTKAITIMTATPDTGQDAAEASVQH